MKGDFHVRFCERLKLKCFGLLDRNSFGHFVVTFYIYTFIGLQLSADGFQIPQQRQALFVSGN